MTSLSIEAFSRARAFLSASARPLEWRRFQCRFEGGPRALVLSELARFQNPDGGFGAALEPDVRTPRSSAVATSFALDVMGEVATPPGEKLLHGAVRHLLDTLDGDRLVWPIVPPEVDDAPHAPWWSHAGTAAAFGGFRANPRAAIVAALLRWPELLPEGWLDRLVADLLAHLETYGRVMEMHDLLGYAALCDRLSGHARDDVLAGLSRVWEESVAADPDAWAGYGLTPLQAVPRPDAALATLVDPGLVAASIAFEIAAQEDDGGWPVRWDWGGAYPLVWPMAHRELRGVVTFTTLVALDAHGRIGPG